jgi:hypothetical protein
LWKGLSIGAPYARPSNTLLVTPEDAADHETTGESITLSFRRYQILAGFAPELHATVRSL